MHIGPEDALIVVDPQRDFLIGGSLPVAGAERIFGPINAIGRLFETVFVTRDAGYDPAFAPPFVLRSNDRVLEKQAGVYSAFAGTGLGEQLAEAGIRRVFVCGLATDYCVKSTALDARERGFGSVVVSDAVAAYNLEPSDEADALRAMREGGVEFTESLSLEAGRPAREG